MEPICIVVANEPCAYREVIAATVQALRPQLAVLAVEPDELDDVLAHLAPQLVICSRLSEVIETRVPTWAVLYPDGEDRATISVAGRRTRLAPVAFDRLLALVDQVAQAPQGAALAT